MRWIFLDFCTSLVLVTWTHTYASVGQLLLSPVASSNLQCMPYKEINLEAINPLTDLGFTSLKSN